jgi:hypothetical protein
MIKNEVKLGCSKQQFNELLKVTLANYKSAWYSFTIKEYKDCIFVKPDMMIQKGRSFVNCKLKFESIKDNEVIIKISYPLTVLPKIFLIVLLTGLYMEIIEVVETFNPGTIFGTFLIITIPTFFYLRERIACQNFWEHFYSKLKLLYKEI